MNTPLVSVLLNVYNGEAFLAETIQSVLNQTYQNFEFIIVDDDSTDRTAEIIRSFDDKRIRYIHNPVRRHIPYAGNLALKQATGEWIARIDADDMWVSDKLEKQIDYLLRHPDIGVCLSYADLVDENSVHTDARADLYRCFHTSFDSRRDWIRNFFFHDNCICNASSIVRKDLMEPYNLFCRQLHDFELWCNLIFKTDFYVYPEELVNYRCNLSDGQSSSPTRENTVRHLNETMLVCRKGLLERLSDEQLIEYFQEDFRCPDSSTPLELKIERAFLLMNAPTAGNGISAVGLAAMEELLHDEQAVTLLEEKYHYSLLQLYDDAAKNIFYTVVNQNDLNALLAERKILCDQVEEQAHKKENLLKEQESLNSDYAKAEEELAHYKLHYETAMAQRNQANATVASYQVMVAAMRNSLSWKITSPIRFVTGHLRVLVNKTPHILLICRAAKSLLTQGPRATWRRVRAHRSLVVKTKRRRKALHGPLSPASFGCKQHELEAERNTTFPRQIKFSILVPLYNTPLEFLNEMISSVQFQTYSNWELCLADGSDSDHPEVGKTCLELAKKDSRIRYQKLDKNLGISGNTNACLDMATGDYIALFDHDDLLHPSALYEDMKAICEQGADFIYTDENTFHKRPADAYCPHYKPDYAPDTLRSYNYICHFTCFSKKLLEKTGLFRPEFDGSQDYDLVLRLTEQAQKIVHIPKILYYWRASATSTAADIGAKPYVVEAGKAALRSHLERIGLKGDVTDAANPSNYRIHYEIEGNPLISILIPSYDHMETLKRCIDSILEKSTYPNFEIVIVENNSKEQKTFDYYESLKQDKRIRVVYWEGKFNYSAINNFGVKHTKGDYLLLLNNDIEVITPNWLEEMLMFAQRKDVGAVGAMLYYPSDKIQHAGVILGIGGVAGHSHKYLPRGDNGYMSRLTIAQNLSAVTAACLMVPRAVYDELDGLDESFEVAFNDVDFCMRIRKAGYLIVWTPYAELYHYESESRGLEDTPEKIKRFNGEIKRFHTRWAAELAAGDPYYNPNFSLDREDFSIRPEADPFADNS